eukprot:2971291-Prymnesium_polylepis.1
MPHEVFPSVCAKCGAHLVPPVLFRQCYRTEHTRNTQSTTYCQALDMWTHTKHKILSGAGYSVWLLLTLILAVLHRLAGGAHGTSLGCNRRGRYA